MGRLAAAARHSESVVSAPAGSTHRRRGCRRARLAWQDDGQAPPPSKRRPLRADRRRGLGRDPRDARMLAPAVGAAFPLRRVRPVLKEAAHRQEARFRSIRRRASGAVACSAPAEAAVPRVCGPAFCESSAYGAPGGLAVAQENDLRGATAALVAARSPIGRPRGAFPIAPCCTRQGEAVRGGSAQERQQ